jgi:hypothetical protein
MPSQSFSMSFAAEKNYGLTAIHDRLFCHDQRFSCPSLHSRPVACTQCVPLYICHALAGLAAVSAISNTTFLCTAHLQICGAGIKYVASLTWGVCAVFYVVMVVIQVVFQLLGSKNLVQRILWTLALWGPILLLSLFVHLAAMAFVMRRMDGDLTEAIFWPLGIIWTGDHSRGTFFHRCTCLMYAPILDIRESGYHQLHASTTCEDCACDARCLCLPAIARWCKSNGQLCLPGSISTPLQEHK